MTPTQRDADFVNRYGPWAVVAGASEGMGRAFADALAERRLNLVISARRKAPLEAAAIEIRERHGVEVEPLDLDLAAPDVLERLRSDTDDRDIGLLVYNAAHAPIGEFLHISATDHQSTIDVNCRSVLALSRHYAERLVARGRGGILLMSSMSGWQGSSMVTTYAATKAFTTVLAEGLWSELKPKGVDVLACVAGATLTPNFKLQTPADRQKSAFPMEPEAVVAEALAKLGNGPTLVAGRMNKLAYALLGRALSRRAAVRFISRTTRGLYAGTGDGTRPS